MSRARRWIRNDVVFIGVLSLLVALTYTPLADPLNEVLCAVSFRGATSALTALGIQFTADAAHRILTHGPFAIEVSGLCSGLRGIALFGAVMILLPLPRRQRLLHFALGVLVLMLVNVVRIVHLFSLGAHGSPRFNLFHEWLWPAAIVGLILTYRLLVRVTPRGRSLEAAHA
jgi:exosortase/archaeosortase family protein